MDWNQLIENDYVKHWQVETGELYNGSAYHAELLITWLIKELNKSGK